MFAGKGYAGVSETTAIPYEMEVVVGLSSSYTVQKKLVKSQAKPPL